MNMVNVTNNLNTQTNRKDYHTELRILLLRHGITQRELARRLNVSPEYLNRVLRGHRAGYAIRNRMVLEFGFPTWLLDSDAAKKAA